MANFSIDLAGRIRNFDLQKQKPLIPLFEAIVNSIYAIEERQEKEEFHGSIEIEIVREEQSVLPLDGIDNSINKVIGFVIRDNGIGLDDNNMRSFLQSDSTYRAEKGGKGVGRFSWLKAFSSVHIESSFCDDGVWSKRSFDFTLDNSEVDDSLNEIEAQEDNLTVVELKNYISAFGKYVPKNGATIANKIMQHCFIYLMSAACPQITVIDTERYCINTMFEEKIKREENSVELDVEGQAFSLIHTEVEDSSFGSSKLYLFANDRMVLEYDLEKEIVDLDKNLYKEKGFYYVGVLSGKFLDDNVSSSRTDFDIPKDPEEGEISLREIVTNATEKVQEHLADYLSAVAEKKAERIQRYIRSEAPQFGHLLRYMPEDIAAIKPTATDQKLDDELYRIKRKFDSNLKKENQEIIKNMEIGASTLDTYQAKFADQIEKISDANKAALSEYVAHRKIILELLRCGIRANDFGKYTKEAYIHNLIYPMRKTSDEIDYKSHNLWLIDERLSYCDYISSDIPFNNDPKEERTDILLLDRPIALSDEENHGKEYESIIVLELKRPMRDDYSTAENPIVQMLEYVDKLSSNSVSDKYKRPIKVGANTQFYLYAVCDLTPKLRKVAETYDFIETPDKMGMYRYHEKKRAYIEILSFDKLINDAEKRNKILFEKLGI